MNRMLFVVLLSMTSLLYADPQPFKNLTGDVPVNDVQQGVIQLPLILWGGDLPFLIANGGVNTKPDSIYGKMGLKIKITHGDDPVQQVKEYLSGKSPFLRMTMRMAGLASELLNNDLKTKPIMVLQQTFSAGDHIVFREDESNLENGKVKVLERKNRLEDFLSMTLELVDLVNRNYLHSLLRKLFVQVSRICPEVIFTQ